MRRTVNALLLSLFGIFLFGVVGCGGGDDAPEPVTAKPDAAPTTPAVTEEPAKESDESANEPGDDPANDPAINQRFIP